MNTKKKPFRLFSKLFLFGIFVFTIGVGLNLRTYQALTQEIPVAKINFQQQNERTFIATLYIPEQPPLQVLLEGDEWQLDAKMVKWEPLRVIFGTPAIFRIDRISGRYLNINDTKTKPHTAHQISTDDGLSIWKILGQASKHLSGIDAIYGTSVYLPMKNQADYDISIGLTGLIARPSNQKASTAVQQWQ